MKRKKNCVKVSGQLLPPVFDLPDDCWELIFRFFNSDEKRRCLKSLSLVSKHFLSITNPFHISLNVHQPTLHFLPTLFQRFTNLSSLDFSSAYCDLNKLLPQISCYPLKIASLNISNETWISFSNRPNFPAYGLRAFSQNIKTLTSLTCSNFGLDYYHDLFLIANYFPLLQILDLSNTALQFSRVNVKLYGMYFEFSKLEVLDLSHTEVYDEELYVISEACRGLLQLSMNNCLRVTGKGVKHVLQNCIQLREINIALCRNVHPSVVASMVFLRPSLQKITVPPGCILSDTEMKLFKRQGCLVC